MPALIADISMSLDGFVADTDDQINDLIGWMFAGDVAVPTAIPGVSFQTSPKSAEVLRSAMSEVGALLCGRRTFDLAGGWGGTHPMGVPVFVVTHSAPTDFESSSITFVTDGLDSAVAQAVAVAGDKTVGVATPSLTRQLLDGGRLDGLHINLVPTLLGAGVPFFSGLAGTTRLDGPDVVESDGVTHLSYRINK